MAVLETGEVAFDTCMDEFDFAAFVDRTRARSTTLHQLVPLLHGGHPVYDGRGSNQVVRMRGYLVAAFEDRGSPEEALVYILEILENSQKPYLVAAAARALRRLKSDTAELVKYLRTAISNIQYRDEPMSFESYAPDWPRDTYTTALEEIVATLKELATETASARTTLDEIRQSNVFNSRVRRSAAAALDNSETKRATDCCSAVKTPAIPSPTLGVRNFATCPADIPNVALEDQDGNWTTFQKAFVGKPTVMGFFYTRCGNPNKCSMTVSKLAELRSVLNSCGMGHSVNIAAVSYDPGYDSAHRLGAYCKGRGFEFDDTIRAWRTEPGQFEAFRDFFNLGVSYAGSVVSRHEIEVYLLNRRGFPVKAYTKLQWENAVVIKAISELP